MRFTIYRNGPYATCTQQRKISAKGYLHLLFDKPAARAPHVAQVVNKRLDQSER